jgi:hypothetical protein
VRAAASEMPRSGNTRVVWLLIGVILLSFAFGVVMFLPAEHRAQKWAEIKKEYQLKVQRAHKTWPKPPSSP